MKRLTFNVKANGKVSMLNLVKAVSKLSCHVGIEFVNDADITDDNCAFPTIKIGETKIVGCNLEDSVIDAIIEFVDENYMIFNMDINDEAEDKKDRGDSGEGNVSNDERLNNSFEELKQTIFWALNEKNVGFGDIRRYIESCTRTMKMSFDDKECITVAPGDIVNCDYGENLPGETNNETYSIVYKVYKDVAYVIPVIWVPKLIFSKFYFHFKKEHTINGNVRGTILLNKGKYVSVKRIISVEDRLGDEAFEEVCSRISVLFAKEESKN